MLKRILMGRLAAFERQFDYDASYLREVLEVSRAAFVKVARLQGLAGHRDGVPPAAWYGAKLVAAQLEDCGPCAQLVVRMAEGAGVPTAVVRGIVRGDADAMGADAALGVAFARATLARDPAADPLRAEVVRRWGQRGLIALAFGIAGTRLYPTLKYALGHGRACSVVRVGDQIEAMRLQPAA